MKTDWLRTSLIAGIALLSFLLVIRWNDFQERNHNKQPSATPTQISESVPLPEMTEPLPESPSVTSNTTEALPELNKPVTIHRSIRVKTDTLDLTIDAAGGDIVKVALPTFYNQIDTPEDPFVLLDNNNRQIYLAKSGLIGANGTDQKNKARPIFESAKDLYELSSNQTSLDVDLYLLQDTGVKIIKRYTFNQGSFVVKISYIVENTTSKPWTAAVYGQIKRDSHDPNISSGLGMKPFLGAATTTNDKNYEKHTFSDISENKISHKKQGGWVAMVQHYFLSAWIPPQENENKYEMFKNGSEDIYYLQFTSTPFSVAPHSTGRQDFQFYAGPKNIKTLETISPYLDLTVDYSFLWWIAKPLFHGLELIHGFVGNWGVAIILLTFFIKLIFFYPSAASYKSMAKMRKIQPKMAALKERCGDDKQKFSAEMMKMYRQEKVNPLGGCLPIIIQMPVFLALYWTLMESVELRHAPFILWISDLSVKDPYYILPLIMGVTMFFQQKLNPTPPDPMQAKIMQMMPVFFTFLMLFFPAGLVLYWVVNNSLSITQQYFITKHIEKQG